MSIKILQISDLHFGPYFDSALMQQVIYFVENERPDAVIISGDLTQRARKKQFQDCQSFFSRLQQRSQLLVIPGNHDVPLYRFWERLAAPYKKYKDHISSALHQSLLIQEQIIVVGINTTHPWRRITDPYLAQSELNFAESVFSQYRDIPQRILVVHQDPFAFPQKINCASFASWLETHKINMLLSGHSHTSFVETILTNDHRTIRIGCGTTTSTRRRKSEADRNTMMEFIVERETVSITRHSIITPGYQIQMETDLGQSMSNSNGKH